MRVQNRFYVREICPLCEQGARGVFRCKAKNSYKLIILCDECQAVWLDIHALQPENAVFPGVDGYIKKLDCFIYDEHAGWAGFDDIRNYGWDKDNLLME